MKPFTETEAHFANAKFYVEDGIPNEVLLVEIPFAESKQGEKKHVRFIIGKDIPSPKEGPRCGNYHSSESTSNSTRVVIVGKTHGKYSFVSYTKTHSGI